MQATRWQHDLHCQKQPLSLANHLNDRQIQEFQRLVSARNLQLHVDDQLADPFMTYVELAELLQVSESSIARKMKELQASGEIRRVGADKNGHWEVVEQSQSVV